MSMGFSTRWFIIQVVAIIVSCRATVSSSTKTAVGCVGSRLDLRCPSTKVIRIESVYRGLSNCTGATCCIKDTGCAQHVSEEHKRSVHSRCDDQPQCTVEIFFQKTTCTSGWLTVRITTDRQAFERITYSCKEGPIVDVTPTNVTITTLYVNPETDDKSDAEQTTDESSSQFLPGVMVITSIVVPIFLVMVTAMVLLVVVMYRRRKRQRVKSLDTVKPSDMDKEEDPKGGRGANGCEAPTGEYCSLERVATGRTQDSSDGAYEECVRGANYEPLNFYEQLRKKTNDKKSKTKESKEKGEKNSETSPSNYCELEGVATTGRSQTLSDNAYEKFTVGKNYEPLNFYELLSSNSADKL